jgi:hypothetical protein
VAIPENGTLFLFFFSAEEATELRVFAGEGYIFKT